MNTVAVARTAALGLYIDGCGGIGLVVYTFVLWVLWLATAAQTVSDYDFYFPSGLMYSYSSYTEQFRHEMQTLEVLAFLNFTILMIYTIAILVLGIIAATRDERVWLSSVKEGTFLGASNPPFQQHPMSQHKGTPAP
ncbi:hypothetical protein HYDPIDRAFT_109403 [Hydnomerulius pinastri MD-312]|nr:hypothetical protein HYDPIDRAFT_109403 [Hydnomerulius pinastri MD-312]